MTAEPLPRLRIDHLSRLTDDAGIFEHATALVPERRHGYTTDDVARALILTVRWRPQTDLTARMTRTYLAFLHDAPRAGRVRNRLTFDRRWVGPLSADAHGRMTWGLCVAAAEGQLRWARETALAGLERLPLLYDQSLRPWVYTALGAAALLDAVPGHHGARALAERAVESLPEPGRSGWIWPEPRLTYDNARLPECLLALGRALEDQRLIADGMRLLEWLVATERHADHFSFTPVGGRGPSDPVPAFDQQPLEATAMLDACALAWRITAERSWLESALDAARWFLGLNDRGISLYDIETGAGHDGLTADGINTNAGAESTISALWALQQARLLEPYQRLEGGLSFQGAVRGDRTTRGAVSPLDGGQAPVTHPRTSRETKHHGKE